MKGEDSFISDPVFSIVDYSTTKGEEEKLGSKSSSFQKEFDVNKRWTQDNTDFEERFVKWCAGEITNKEFMKDEDKTLFGASTVDTSRKEKEKHPRKEDEKMQAKEIQQQIPGMSKKKDLGIRKEKPSSQRNLNLYKKRRAHESIVSRESSDNGFELNPVIHDDISSIGNSIPSFTPYSNPYLMAKQRLIAQEANEKKLNPDVQAMKPSSSILDEFDIEASVQKEKPISNLLEEDGFETIELGNEKEKAVKEDTKQGAKQDANTLDTPSTIQQLKNMCMSIFDNSTSKNDQHPTIEEIKIVKEDFNENESIAERIAKVKAELKSVYKDLNEKDDERVKAFVHQNRKILETIEEEEDGQGDNEESIHITIQNMSMIFKSNLEGDVENPLDSSVEAVIDKRRSSEQVVDDKKELGVKRCAVFFALLFVAGIVLLAWYFLRVHYKNAPSSNPLL
ncbi:predicted protein [Chaetoceros tenuissimus]|uniref:Uncharacterized protein n=1 Tax=Chaetoceros tenuissimus TaxID=426638 RepID=A0AAD3HE29_9STRA|nr:predicted protein [Chaetoceros tenuissimus]